MPSLAFRQERTRKFTRLYRLLHLCCFCTFDARRFSAF